MIGVLLPFFILPLTMSNPLQLNLLSTSNVSSATSEQPPARNATRLTTHNTCFDTSGGYIFTAAKNDCEQALDKIVSGKSLIELRSFSYKDYGVTDRLPLQAEHGTCIIILLTFEVDKRITMTYAEIYAELLGPDGLLKECLVRDTNALGGHTALGPGNMLVADVTGKQNSR